MGYGCKKVVATGARTTVVIQEERCFGYLNAEVLNPENYLGRPKRIDIVSESIVNEIGTFQSAALNPDRAVIRRQQGTNAVGGDINVELSGNGYDWLIVQAIGRIKGAGITSDPYTILPVDKTGVNSDETAGYLQTASEYVSDEITYNPAFSACDGYERGSYVVDPNGMEPGVDLLICRDGGTIGGFNGEAAVNKWWFKYSGMKVNSWSVTASPTEIVTSTFSFLGRNEAVVDIDDPPAVERPAINDPFSGFNGRVLIDGQEECVLNFEMTVNNNLGADQFCMGDKNRNSLPEGRREIEGNISVEFTDLIYYKKFLDGTGVSLIVDFDLFEETAPGTETMRIILPHIEFNGTTPTAGGPEAMAQELPFTAIFDKSPEAQALLTVPAYAPNGYDIAIEVVTAGALV